MSTQGLYYKMAQPDGTDFRTGTVDYIRALKTGEVIRHRTSTVINPADHSTFLSVATTPGDSSGNFVPLGRLFQVEAVGEVKRVTCPVCIKRNHNWRAVLALRVVKELPHAEVFGPNGALILELVDVMQLAPDEFFWALAKNYEPPLPEGVGLKINDAVRYTGCFVASLTLRFWLAGIATYRAPPAMPVDAKAKVAQALIDTACGILTRGLIDPEYTTVCLRTWRKTFGAAEYA